jgi:hypothetical protein
LQSRADQTKNKVPITTLHTGNKFGYSGTMFLFCQLHSALQTLMWISVAESYKDMKTLSNHVITVNGEV